MGAQAARQAGAKATAAVGNAVIATRPSGSLRADRSASAASIMARISPAWSASRRPASVSSALRAVRSSSAAPGLPLQRGELLGDRRRRVAERGGGGRDAAALGELQQQPEPVHVEHKLSLSSASEMPACTDAPLRHAGQRTASVAIILVKPPTSVMRRQCRGRRICPRTRSPPHALGRACHHDRTAPLTRARDAAPSLSPPPSPPTRSSPPAARGQPVLPLAFGEAGLPVHPGLRAELADAAGLTPTARSPASPPCARPRPATGPGAACRPPGRCGGRSGQQAAAVRAAARAGHGRGRAEAELGELRRAGQADRRARRTSCPAGPGEGGCCDPGRLEPPSRPRRAAGRPDRRGGRDAAGQPDRDRLASPDAVRELCAVADRHDLIIISDEIYRDLVHDPAAPFLSPAAIAPERTVVTTALSKSLAVGGWRIGVARMPDGPAGVAAAGPAARHRQRDLVGPVGPGPARGRRRPSASRRSWPNGSRAAGRCTPRSPGGGAGCARRGTRGARAAGRVLPVPGLRPVAGLLRRPAS